jgi:hypothetical protein
MPLLVANFQNVTPVGEKESLMHLNIAGFNCSGLACASRQCQQAIG